MPRRRSLRNRPSAAKHTQRWVLAALVVCATIAGSTSPPATAFANGSAARITVDTALPEPDPPWQRPVEGRILEPYRAPAQEYGPGHRGVDFVSDVTASVRAPEAGVVAFRGAVAGRPVITIDHGSGLVLTLEPVDSELKSGDSVARGEQVGTVNVGGHSPVGALHVGVRFNGEYINPMLMFGEVERAVLLPCC